MSIFKIKDKKLDLSTTIVMGILNITNDSFYDGGQYLSTKNILIKTEQMLKDGASIIDIGAQSSRPGAKDIKPKLEKERLINAIKNIKQYFPEIIISVDTYRAEIAKSCIESGADMINDISAGNMDNKMLDVIIDMNIPYIMMHMQGIPENMQKKPTYKNVTNDILSFFQEKTKILLQKGFKKIIIDPGFGFGKNLQHNYQLLNNLEDLTKLGFPLLIGISRKSMIYNLLDITPEEALNGTTILNIMALQNSAKILRVHDVKEAMECIKIVNFVKNCKQ